MNAKPEILREPQKAVLPEAGSTWAVPADAELVGDKGVGCGARRVAPHESREAHSPPLGHVAGAAVRAKGPSAGSRGWTGGRRAAVPRLPQSALRADRKGAVGGELVKQQLSGSSDGLALVDAGLRNSAVETLGLAVQKLPKLQ